MRVALPVEMVFIFHEARFQRLSIRRCVRRWLIISSVTLRVPVSVLLMPELLHSLEQYWARLPASLIAVVTFDEKSLEHTMHG